MSVYGNMKSIQAVAAADLSGQQYKIVSIAGTIAAGPDDAFGIQQNKPGNGEDLTIGYEGHMKGIAGGTITVGAPLKVVSSGYLTVVASGDPGSPCGKAIAAVASGGVFEGIFNFATTNATITASQ